MEAKVVKIDRKDNDWFIWLVSYFIAKLVNCVNFKRGAFNKFPEFLYRNLKLSLTLENSVGYYYTSDEMTDQFLWFQVQRNTPHSWWISKMQSGRENTLEERYAMKFCFKLEKKNATETYGMLQTAFGASCMNRASVLEWHKRFKEGRESLRDDERCGRSKEVRTPEMIGHIKNFMDKDPRMSIETISVQCDVSLGTVHTIIREELKMQNICAKFVPRVPRLLEQDGHQDSSTASL